MNTIYDAGLIEFIASEIEELESRDVDTLYDCISDNIREMGLEYEPDFVYEEIERQLKRAAK